MDLGQLLADEGLVDPAAVRFAADVAEREGKALCAVIVDGGLVAEDTLADALSRVLGVVVIDVEQGTLDTEAVHLVGEATARRFLAVVVSTDSSGESVRVAFANPLDDDAVRAMREQTGRNVQPLVATVSGVRAAIEREYRRRTTRVLRAQVPRTGSEIAPEITRRVEGSQRRSPSSRAPEDGVPEGTSPLHRLEPEASSEQRHEALVLALIETGVITRADYVQALKRLLGK